MVFRMGKPHIAANAALVALAQLAALGCGSQIDGSPEGTPSAAGAAVAALEQEKMSRLYAALPSGPIAAVGHGMVITPDGSVVEPTPDFARSAQQTYIERLLNEASPEVRTAFEQERSISEPEVGAPREFAMRAELIDWLIERVQPSDASDISAKNRFLVYAVEPADLAFVESSNRENYVATCRAEGVPTPPDWADDPTSTGWTLSGVIETDFVKRGTATAWYKISTDSTTPGLCIALPRIQDGADPDTGEPRQYIDLLGIICQGKNSGKVCFWDNQEDFYLPMNETKKITEDFVSPDEIEATTVDRCTVCHRGENAYIIHPGTALDIDRKVHGDGWKFNPRESYLRASKWVEPLVHDAWFKNLPWTESDLLEFRAVPLADDGVRPETSCFDCHYEGGEGGALGQLGPDYCTSVLLKSLDVTMPPQAYLDGVNTPDNLPHTPSVGHQDFLRTRCRNLK